MSIFAFALVGGSAFAIASRLGISQEIIKASKAKIDNGTRSFEGLIGKLEKQRLELEGKKETTDKKLAHAEKMYDIVYIDANKREYCEYYDLVFDMIRPGGLILADNVLWDGKVCMDPLPQDKQTVGIARFNDMVSADPRVESVILPLRDGLNVIRKK